MDRRRRSLVKAAVWRLIAFTVTVLSAYFFLGEWKSSLSIGFLADGIKIFLYYIHERAWLRVGWGIKS